MQTFYLICQNAEHENSPIIGTCLAPNCSSLRPYCAVCKMEFHKNHIALLYKFEEFDSIRQKTINDLQSVISAVCQMKTQIDELLSILSHFKLNEQHLQNLNIQEVHKETEKILSINNLKENFQDRIQDLTSQICQLKKDIKGNNKSQEIKVTLEIPQTPQPKKRLENIFLEKHHQQSNSLSPSNSSSHITNLSKSHSLFGSQAFRQKSQQNEDDIMITKNPNIPINLQLKVTQFKDQRIQVNNNIIFAENAGGLVFFEPQIQDCYSQYFLIKVRYIYNNMLSNIWFGIGSKAIGESNSYRIYQKDLGHGCFMMDQQGTVISNHRSIDNNIKKGFSFSKEQTIQVEVKYQQKIITFTNQATTKSITFPIDTRLELYPCAYINYASIEVVNQN